MHVPAQARADRGALADEVLAVVDEELQLAQLRVVGSARQVRLAQGRAGHREGVDRVRLAVGAGGVPLPCGQAGADPQHQFLGAQ